MFFFFLKETVRDRDFSEESHSVQTHKALLSVCVCCVNICL